MLQKIITYSFYLLFFLTPLIWTSKNYELFEYNKMMFVYGLTVIITTSWILKMIQEKTLIFNRTPLDIPLLVFLGAMTLSTIFSIDPHTSVWGYYSRSNGGLLSIVSYLLLYFAFVSNIEADNVLKHLKVAILSGIIVAVWGISEHFGISFSCVILRGDFNVSCWIQDVQARVFATLGQPNWMAAYLAMLIFPTLYFFLTAPGKTERIAYFLALITLYLASTFTYSRGPMLGLITGMVIFLILFILSSRRRAGSNSELNLFKWIPAFAGMTKQILIVLASFLIINILFGSALTSFRLVSEFAAPIRPSIAMPAVSPTGTQLENGGTESGQIRLIVWQGALDIFRHYTILGTGVETFAYSYYQFRPALHNLTSEWDFLYNKAHNEFLNYLATTGIVGFASFSIIVITFINIILRKPKNQNQLLSFALLASYISFLIQAFFLFSVVITNLFFFLFPALAFVALGTAKPLTLPKQLNALLYRRPFYVQLAKGIAAFSTIYILYSILQFWYADTLFSLGEKSSEAGNPGRAYNLLSVAVGINPGEPFYRSELGYAAASAAVALLETDATLSAQLAKEAVNETSLALTTSPKNVSYWRTAIRTYFELSTIDKQFTDQTLKAVDKSIKLAPTDPKLYLTKATILESIGKNIEAEKGLQKAIELKPNYLEAYINVAKINIIEKNYDKAMNTLKAGLKIFPNNPSLLELLVNLGKLGIATESATIK